MFLHNIKIRSKLFMAFGLFIVLMVVSSALSLFSLDRANTGMQNIITNDYPTTVKANLFNRLILMISSSRSSSCYWMKRGAGARVRRKSWMK